MSTNRHDEQAMIIKEQAKTIKDLLSKNATLMEQLRQSTLKAEKIEDAVREVAGVSTQKKFSEHGISLYQIIHKKHLDVSNKLSDDAWRKFVQLNNSILAEEFSNAAQECFDNYITELDFPDEDDLCPTCNLHYDDCPTCECPNDAKCLKLCEELNGGRCPHYPY